MHVHAHAHTHSAPREKHTRREGMWLLLLGVLLVLLVLWWVLRRRQMMYWAALAPRLNLEAIRHLNCDAKQLFVPGHNGCMLHVVESGPSHGQLVVLLHGFPECWASWIRQIPALTRCGYHVVCPDLRGYNLSDKPAGIKNYRVPFLLEDLKALLQRFDGCAGGAKPVLVGHDFGGAISWLFGHRYPDLISKITILNAPHPKVLGKLLSTNAAQRKKSRYMMFFQLPWLPELILTRTAKALWSGITSSLSNKFCFTKEQVDIFTANVCMEGSISCMIHWYRSFRRFRQDIYHLFKDPSCSAKIPVPVQVIWGCQDHYLLPENAELTADFCVCPPRIVRLENCSHWTNNDVPEDVTQEIIHFVDSPVPS